MDANTATTSISVEPPAPAKQKLRHTRQSSRLGIKKRKPRSTAVITAANHRARAAAASLPAAPPVAISPPPRFPLPPPHLLPPALPFSSQSSLTQENPLPSQRKSPPSRATDSKRKGLRHFAIRVSRKVEEKVDTTYNEVADELVVEERINRQRQLFASGETAVPDQPVTVDEKNIRRRVYDSLNVLMAMGIIAKEKKLITWKGLAMAQSPHRDEEFISINTAIAEKKRSLEEKAKILAEIKEQYRKQMFIVDRNRSADPIPGVLDDLLSLPQNMAPLHQQYPNRLGIPYIIVSAPNDTNIELEMDESREDICFTFNSAFAIYDDREILRRMEIPCDPSSSGNSISEVERLRRHVLEAVTTPSGTP